MLLGEFALKACNVKFMLCAATFNSLYSNDLFRSSQL